MVNEVNCCLSYEGAAKGPLVQRGLSASADWGIDNPSVTASPCHLPLHKGGSCLRRSIYCGKQQFSVAF